METHEAQDAAWTPRARAAVSRWKPVANLKNRLLTRIVVSGSRFWMRHMNTLVTVDEDRLADARAMDQRGQVRAPRSRGWRQSTGDGVPDRAPHTGRMGAYLS